MITKFYEYYRKKPYYKSFAYHLEKQRNEWQKLYGVNWDKFISKEQLKNKIRDILDLPPGVLYMSKIERRRWRNKMDLEDLNYIQILRIFYDAELSSIGLAVNKNRRDYL